MKIILGALAGFVLTVAAISALNALGGVTLVVVVGALLCGGAEIVTRRLRGRL